MFGIGSAKSAGRDALDRIATATLAAPLRDGSQRSATARGGPLRVAASRACFAIGFGRLLDALASASGSVSGSGRSSGDGPWRWIWAPFRTPLRALPGVSLAPEGSSRGGDFGSPFGPRFATRGEALAGLAMPNQASGGRLATSSSRHGKSGAPPSHCEICHTRGWALAVDFGCFSDALASASGSVFGSGGVVPRRLAAGGGGWRRVTPM